MAATLIAAANDDAALGRPWHAVSNEPRSQQQLADDLADTAGVERRKVRPMPKVLLWAARPFAPITRPVYELLYQYEAPFVVDDSAARTAFALEPTQWVEVVAETAADRRPLRTR
jgi:nucleoside-diphosphate-sugar epimerase